MAAQAQIKINGTIGSNSDLPINTLVQLDNQNAGGESSFGWQVIDQPPGTADVLSSTTIQNPTFTPRKEGTYLIRLVVNANTATEQTNTVIAAVRHLKSRERIPAAGEDVQADANDGWALDVGQNGGTPAGSRGLLHRVDDLFNHDFGIVIGQAGASGLVKGTVLHCTGVATIKSGLPGEEIVPKFDKALATTPGPLASLLGVCEGGVDGNASPASGALIRVRVAGLYSATVAGAQTMVSGDPVYVSDTGTLSLTTGSNTRKIGTGVQPAGIAPYYYYYLWVCGSMVD